jgi:hypothetical protein
MSRVRGIGRFAYDFVIGDDWTAAVIVVIAIASAALLAHHGVAAWWVVPTGVTISLVLSLVRFTRRA